MCDKLGEGHFGTVYSGNWHGPVAIKVINMDYLDYEKTLEAFKAEVKNLLNNLYVRFKFKNVKTVLGGYIS